MTESSAPLPASLLEALRRYDTPTICNAMEVVARLSWAELLRASGGRTFVFGQRKASEGRGVAANPPSSQIHEAGAASAAAQGQCPRQVDRADGK